MTATGSSPPVARQLGIGPESVRNWVRQAEIDGGQRDGLTTDEGERLKHLERETASVKSLRYIAQAQPRSRSPRGS